MITHLEPNQVFVFGSNLAGEHVGGAAQQAFKQFGAEWGIGEGLAGQCYAFPTLDADYKKRSEYSLLKSVMKFYDCARANPNMEFLLTKVGCGIAGYSEEYIKDFFRDTPDNVVKPDDW